MSIRILTVSIYSICVVLTASTAAWAQAAQLSVAGRWHDDRVWEMSRSPVDCKTGQCGLTLDIVACGEAWCGIEVTPANTCGATALKFETGKDVSSGGARFTGKLQLAQGTEPYAVEAYLSAIGNGPQQLSMTGDTGGQFRIFRRSFPFHANLARVGDAVCQMDKPVS